MLRTIRKAVMFAALWACPALAASDQVTVGMVLEPPNLDPTANAAAAIDEVTQLNIFEGLTRIMADGTIAPALAASWDVEDGGKVYVFHLRQGVKFHDGTDFDAKDVVFSLNRARGEDSVNAQKALFAGIAEVQALDPATVKVVLNAPDGAFPFKMAWGDAVMVAPESAGQNATHPVGTGPFQFGEWRKGDRIRLDAFAGYWGEKPRIQSATFRFIGDPTAAFAAMMAGDVNMFPNYPAPETLAQIGADPRFKVIVGTTEGETILALNHARAPLDNLKMREAIAHAVNRQDLIDGAMFGYGTPIGTHFAPHHPDYVDLTAQSSYDPDRSRALLAEIGGAGRVLGLALPPTPYARRGGEIIAAQLRAVGIETKITTMEWAQWLETVYKNADYDMTVISHVEPMDIGIYGRDPYYFNYAPPAFVDLMRDLDAATDPAQRSALIQQAQKMIADDFANIYLFQLPKTGVADAKLDGIWPNAPMPVTDLAALYWQE